MLIRMLEAVEGTTLFSVDTEVKCCVLLCTVEAVEGRFSSESRNFHYDNLRKGY